MRHLGGVGLRQVTYVRVDVRQRPATAHAIGVSHRVPTEIPISLAAAARLAASGTPVVLVDHDGAH